MIIDMNKAIANMESLKAKKITYSMYGSRDGSDGTGDCSGTVVSSLYKAGAIKYDWLYNTDSMHDYLTKNNFEAVKSEKDGHFKVKRGDVFIWGKKGWSSGASGHTGIVLDEKEKIIHCNYGYNGVAVTDHDTIWRANGEPFSYFYRLKSTTSGKRVFKDMHVQVDVLNVRKGAGVDKAVVGSYEKGKQLGIYTDSKKVVGGYLWGEVVASRFGDGVFVALELADKKSVYVK